MSAHASQRVRPGLSRFARLLVLVALAACRDGEEPLDDPPAPTTKVDACGGGCSSEELCAQDAEGQYTCLRICANQLRCWSGCCLALEGTRYNVCRPTNLCFPDEPVPGRQ